jgi:hypothetical protein
MALSKATISGSYRDAVDAAGLTEPVAVFLLSGIDTEVAAVVVPTEVVVTLTAQAALPAGFGLWRNTVGLRGTYYRHVLRGKRVLRPGFADLVEIPLGLVQIGEAASYTVTELLNNPVPDAPSWNVNIHGDAYDQLMEDVAAGAEVASRSLSLERLGVVAGADAPDQAPAIAAALVAAAGRPVQSTPGAVYRLMSTVVLPGSARLDMSMSSVLVGANVRAFQFSAPIAGPFALTADYVPGSKQLAVSGPTVAPKAGAVLWIACKGLDPANRDNGSSAQKYRSGEAVIVAEGSTTALIQLESPLTLTEVVDPVSSAGDEALIAPYTVALETVIALPDMDAVLDFQPPAISYEDGHDGDGWNAGAIEVRAYHRPIVKLGAVPRGYGFGVLLSGTYEALVDQFEARNLTDNPSSQLGYAVADRGWRTTVRGLKSSNVRHAYTTTGVSAAFAAPVDPYLLGAVARTTGALIDAPHGIGGEAAIFSTHADAQDQTYDAPVAEGGASLGFNMRGRNIRLNAPVVLGCFAGIGYFTEFDDGDPNDDRYNNGKLTRHFTSGTILSPMVNCLERCLDVRAATVGLAGVGTYRAAANCLMYTAGGVLTIAGRHDFVLSGNTLASTGAALIDVSGTNAYTSAAFPDPAIVIDGVVTADATGWTGDPLDVISAVSSRLVIRGLLRLLLPAGANLFLGGTANVVCEGNGRIEYLIAGSSGIVTGLSDRPIYLVDLASGEVMDATGRSNARSGYNRVTEYTGNSQILRFGGGASHGLRLRALDEVVANGQSLGGITLETNDVTNPAMDAGRILWRAAGTLGYGDLFVQRRDSGAGALVDALVVRASGAVDFLKADGTTVGMTWDAAAQAFVVSGSGGVRLGSASGPLVLPGSGTPEGAVSAPVGSLFLRTDGGAGTSLYVKQSGSGNTGWVGK